MKMGLTKKSISPCSTRNGTISQLQKAVTTNNIEIHVSKRKTATLKQKKEIQVANLNKKNARGNVMTPNGQPLNSAKQQDSTPPIMNQSPNRSVMETARHSSRITNKSIVKTVRTNNVKKVVKINKEVSNTVKNFESENQRKNLFQIKANAKLKESNTKKITEKRVSHIKAKSIDVNEELQHDEISGRKSLMNRKCDKEVKLEKEYKTQKEKILDEVIFDEMNEYIIKDDYNSDDGDKIEPYIDPNLSII